MKPILYTALLFALAACNMYDGTHSASIPSNGVQATTNCRDWNYKPGTKAYNDCVKNMSSVHKQ